MNPGTYLYQSIEQRDVLLNFAAKTSAFLLSPIQCILDIVVPKEKKV